MDASQAAQILSIDQTFAEVDSYDLTAKHPDPKRKDLKVVEVGMHWIAMLTRAVV